MFSSQGVSQVSEGSEARTFGHMKLEDGREEGMGKGCRGGTKFQRAGRSTFGKVKVTLR